ncbi:hypothetical protein Pta6605_09680 [Pseudomonas amygdali pv. tabaci]|nr:hypothetical protein Pta6605_09680 [Pseudomonas amygdali pv. tabaci]
MGFVGANLFAKRAAQSTNLLRLEYSLREQIPTEGFMYNAECRAEHTHRNHCEFSHSTIPSPAARPLAKQAVSR